MADGFNLCHLEPSNSGWNRCVLRPTGVLTTVAVSRCHTHKRGTPVCVCLCVYVWGRKERLICRLSYSFRLYFFFVSQRYTQHWKTCRVSDWDFCSSKLKKNIFRGIFKIIHPKPMEKVQDYLLQLILSTQFHLFHDSYLHDNMQINNYSTN